MRVLGLLESFGRLCKQQSGIKCREHHEWEKQEPGIVQVLVQSDSPRIEDYLLQVVPSTRSHRKGTEVFFQKGSPKHGVLGDRSPGFLPLSTILSERRAGTKLGNIVRIQVGRKKDLTVRKRENLGGSKGEIPNEKKMNIKHEAQQRPARHTIGR